MGSITRNIFLDEKYIILMNTLLDITVPTGCSSYILLELNQRITDGHTLEKDYESRVKKLTVKNIKGGQHQPLIKVL